MLYYMAYSITLWYNILLVNKPLVFSGANKYGPVFSAVRIRVVISEVCYNTRYILNLLILVNYFEF